MADKKIHGFTPIDEDGEAPTMSMAMPPSTYTLNGDIAEVVRLCVKDYPEKLGHLRDVAIACLRRDSTRSEDDFTVDGAGGGFVRGDRERGVDAGWDIGIRFRGRWWDKMDGTQRRAWVFHQLSHFQTRAKGVGLRRVGHDVEAFVDEAVLFGSWESQLELFEANLERRAAGKPGPIAAINPHPVGAPAVTPPASN